MGLSQRSIASSCQCSRNTVSEVLSRANQKELTWPLSEDVVEEDLRNMLFPEKAQQASSRKLPDCEHIHREMAKSGVTLSLLWSEYCEVCRLSNEIPLMYSQFCNYYRKFAATTKATMHIHRKPGEQLEVDWAGQTTAIVDQDTGELIPVYVFVAALSSSQYAYVEGFLSMNQESWIAHIFTPSLSLVASLKSLYQITSKRVWKNHHRILLLSTKYIMKWPSTMVRLLFQLVSESPKIRQV
jgi:transposase